MVKDHEQVSRVIALAHEVWERFGLAAAERYDDEVIDYLIGRIRELDESTEASLRVYLNHDQLHRFRRIRLGAMGCDAFLFPEIEQALGLSDDQRIKIREAMRETGRREAVEWLKANRDPFGPEPEVLANLRWEERRRIASVLTQGQLAWWREIAEVPTEAELFGRRLGYSVLKNLREWRASLPPVAHSPQVPSRSLPTPGKTQASQ
jgi:hypothetical protein